jgi:hypothetical protein
MLIFNGDASSPWHESPNPCIAQEKPEPYDHAKEKGHPKGFGGADVGSDCAAEVSGEQDRAEDGCLRDRVEQRAGYFDKE